MIGFWWQDVTGPYNITILGSVYFNNVYVFNMAEATGGMDDLNIPSNIMMELIISVTLLLFFINLLLFILYLDDM
jgi:hypothetical protein